MIKLSTIWYLSGNSTKSQAVKSAKLNKHCNTIENIAMYGKLHMNGSLFFCQQFRINELEERKAIQSILHNFVWAGRV